jgi:hypothetical protein
MEERPADRVAVEVSNVALQQGLQHLQNAYMNFWAKRAKYPGLKSKHKSRASASFTTSGFRYRDGQIWLANLSAPLAIETECIGRSPCRFSTRGSGEGLRGVARDSGEWRGTQGSGEDVPRHPAASAMVGAA